MHEIEVGIFKAVFRHLLRILYVLGEDRITLLNERFATISLEVPSVLIQLCRYRKMPAFGNDAIRRFKRNVSGQTRIAARELEDIMQVLTYDPLLE